MFMKNNIISNSKNNITSAENWPFAKVKRLYPEGTLQFQGLAT